jgi:hypothetical protein
MMAPETTFIFMLTRDDRTVADAAALLEEALASGVRHIGFKDIGVPFACQRALADRIHAAGGVSYLEVVSLDAASEGASAAAARELGVKVLMGGQRPDVVLPVIGDLGIRYLPFAGRIAGHPSRLQGSIDDIVRSATALASLDKVDGIDLLAYRSAVDAEQLMRAVAEAVGPKPVVVAGSIDRVERIGAAVRNGAAGFTVGTAALDGRFAVASGLRAQLECIGAAARSELASRQKGDPQWTR